jgi:hypothetical protein
MVPVTGPKTDQDKLAKIFQHSLSKGWFGQTVRIFESRSHESRSVLGQAQAVARGEHF